MYSIIIYFNYVMFNYLGQAQPGVYSQGGTIPLGGYTQSGGTAQYPTGYVPSTWI